MTTTNPICSSCASELPPGRVEGLCPKCLLLNGLQSRPPTIAPTESSDKEGGLPSFLAPSPGDLEPHFPQLEILELLGVGGMGAVYKARQASLDRLVALKILPSEVGRDPAFAERFTREAKALARLNHPHIVTIHDIGQAGGLYYIVMEYIDGANLRQLMMGGNLTPEQALALVPQLCEALQYAHDEGILHRDIKPENILVDKRGRAKVADFGLAKIVGERLPNTSLTATQQVMGTLRYMAPEQMLGVRDVDHRADIYALGVVFYELLTGDLPMGRFPLPSEKSRCDARLDEVVLKALERERERRYQQAREIKTDVDAISKTYRPGPTPTSLPAKATVAAMTLSAEDFEQAAADIRPVGSALAALAALQLLLAVGVALAALVIWFLPVPRITATDTWPGFAIIAVLHIPVALLLLPAGLTMRRLRNYEFAVIGAAVALLPLGFTWIFTFPLGLWALLVLLRAPVRSAFRQLLRDRPAHFQDRDAETIESSQRQSADYRQAMERVRARCRSAGLAQMVIAGCDLVAAMLLLCVMLTQSRGMPVTWVWVFLVGLPAAVACIVWSGAFCLIRMRGWRLAMAGAVFNIVPLSPLWFVRWIVGIWALATLLRRDVQAAFRALEESSPSEASLSEKSVFEQPGVYATPPGAPLPPLSPPTALLLGGIILGALLMSAGVALIPLAFLISAPGSSPFFGWLGGAFGCICGGLGSLAGSWNDYRQKLGRRNLMAEPEWTWFDEGLWLLLVAGMLLLLAAPFSYYAWSHDAGYAAALLGAILTVQGAILGTSRTSMRKAARQQLAFDAAESTWGSWWRERNSWFRQIMSTLMMAGFLASLVLFFSFETAGQQAADAKNEWADGLRRTTVGQPTPWLTIERLADNGGVRNFRSELRLNSWAWLYGVAAFAFMEATALTRRWDKPGTRSSASARAVLAGMAVAIAAMLALFVGLSL